MDSQRGSGKGGAVGVARTVGYLLAGLLVGFVVVVVMRSVGADRDAQRIGAFVSVIGALLLLLRSGSIETRDPLAVLVTLLALGAASVSALSFIGSIEEPARLGCLNTDGPIQATVRVSSTVYSRARLDSDPKGLVLRGCQLRFTGYCIGTVHQNVFDREIPDSRWLILADGRGLVAAGDTVGTIPRHVDPSKCPGGVSAPNALSFTKAVIDERTDRALLLARAPRAAMIGFALKRPDGRWQRLGWNRTAEAGGSETFYLPARASVGSLVAATACMALRRPAGATKQLRLGGPGRSGTPPRFRVTQPIGSQPSDVACDAGLLPVDR
jgi:hypothetical protein